MVDEQIRVRRKWFWFNEGIVMAPERRDFKKEQEMGPA
jgi:hypothetical protein